MEYAFVVVQFDGEKNVFIVKTHNGSPLSQEVEAGAYANQFGQQGWNLINGSEFSLIQDTYVYLLIFQRALHPKPAGY